MTYLLRRAELEDLPEMIRHESEIFGHDAWSPELMVAEVSHPMSYYLVARSAETKEFAGYAGLRAAVTGGEGGDIQTIATLAQHRGKGLGRTLLRALLEEARNRRVQDIFLEVRADNPTALVLYESEGFAVIDRREGYYQPDGVAALVMRRHDEGPHGGWTQ